MDETPLFMNIASTKTIYRIGSKEVVIKTHGQKNACHCNIMYVAYGTKLPSMLAFKGQPEGRV